MSLVYFSTNPIDWYALEGIYIALTQPPAPASIDSNAGLTKLVAEMPWGPVNKLVAADTGKKLKDQLVGEAKTPTDYKGMRAITGKQWGNLHVVRVGHSGQAKSSVTLQDSVPQDAYTIEAKYVGAVGDEIEYEHVDNGDGTFDLTITWGQQSVTYEGLELTTASLDDGVDNDFVNVTVVNTGASVPADATGTLSGGSDGTPGDSDYSDALDVFAGDDDGGVVLAAEYTSSAWIAALQTHVAARDLTIGMAQADPADDIATNVTSAEAISDNNLVLAGHRVQQFLDSTLTDVDLAPWLASVAANTSPHISLGAYRTNEYLQPLRGFAADAAPSRQDFIDAKKAGLVLVEQDEGKWIPKSGIMSDGSKFNRRRMQFLVGKNLGQALKPFKSEPQYGSNIDGAKVAMRKKLDVLLGSKDIPDSQLIEAYQVIDVDQTATAVIYKTKVELYGDMDNIVNNVVVGATVEITEA